MSKKILFIGYDENGGHDNPRDWDNLGELTTFSSRNFTDYDEGKNRWDNVEEALMRDFGLQAHHYKGKGGGLVLLLDRDPRDGTLSVQDTIVYTEQAMAAREELEEELGEYAADEIAERLGYEFRGVDGLFIVPFATIISEYGSLDEAAIARATSYLEGELQTYNMWAQGEVYYGVLVDATTGEELDSCGGFIGDDPKQSGLLETFDYDEVANYGRPYYDHREMRQAIDALAGDEGYDFEDEDEDGGRTPNPHGGPHTQEQMNSVSHVIDTLAKMGRLARKHNATKTDEAAWSKLARKLIMLQISLNIPLEERIPEIPLYQDRRDWFQRFAIASDSAAAEGRHPWWYGGSLPSGKGRTPNPSVPLNKVGDYIWNRIPFKGNSISGLANDHGTGRLHAHSAADFDTAVRKAKSQGPLRDTFYAVYSYNTPIAWWVKGLGAGGEWTIVAKTALAGSVTTSKHLAAVRKEMPSARVINPASSRRTTPRRPRR